ncbi:hypothetical protein SAMN00808754_1665 [Thermanaeromonas toyohensis ToBE]|uniref:Uncharacterized protein n=2 Tax=Thermanaeromonas TaxID=202949 RepID=A0A1W1VU60_9FIRM|nr:hypothetical protein SAMN00808754_1665 [Thermanaeromonas toyohensis ToBE]
MCELYVLVFSPGDGPHLRAFRAVVQLVVTAMAATRGLDAETVEFGSQVYLAIKGDTQEIAAFAEELNRQTGLGGFTVLLGGRGDVSTLRRLHRRGVVRCAMA